MYLKVHYAVSIIELRKQEIVKCMIYTTYTINTQHTIQLYTLKNTKRFILLLIGGEGFRIFLLPSSHFHSALILGAVGDYRGGSHLA